MDFYIALEFIKTYNKAAYAIRIEEYEIYTMSHEEDASKFEDILIFWAQTPDENNRIVGVYTVIEALTIHPTIERMDFIPMEKAGINAIDMIFPSATEWLKENEITLKEL